MQCDLEKFVSVHSILKERPPDIRAASPGKGQPQLWLYL